MTSTVISRSVLGTELLRHRPQQYRLRKRGARHDVRVVGRQHERRHAPCARPRARRARASHGRRARSLPSAASGIDTTILPSLSRIKSMAAPAVATANSPPAARALKSRAPTRAMRASHDMQICVYCSHGDVCRRTGSCCDADYATRMGSVRTASAGAPPASSTELRLTTRRACGRHQLLPLYGHQLRD